MTTRRFSQLAAILMVSVVIAPSARAGDFDGSRDLLCAPRDVVECNLSAECERIPVGEAQVPAFIRVQFGRKRLASVSGPERSSPIELVKQIEGATILQGTQTGRAWSIVIDHATGQLSASIADTEGAFAILGACAPD